MARRALLLAAVLNGAWRSGAHGPHLQRHIVSQPTYLDYASGFAGASSSSSSGAQRPGGRRLQAHQEWERIRIHAVTNELEGALSEEVVSYIRDDLLPAAIRWLSKVLRVRPVQGRLQFEQGCLAEFTLTGECAQVDPAFQTCGSATIPRDHFRDRSACATMLGVMCETSEGGEGIANADFAIYVTAENTDWCVGTAAYAGTCQQDQNDRPVGGYLNFCQGYLSGRADFGRDVATTIHELLHALGFSSSLLAWFRDDEGNPRTERDSFGRPPTDGQGYVADTNTVLRTVQADGASKHFVVLPRVLQTAREYYGCPTLDKIALEDGGGDGSAFSHWEERLMYSEVMTPEVTNHARFSGLTMALLEDSGWYKPDYKFTGSFSYGRGKGCEFVTGRCVVDGETSFPDTFCDKTTGNTNAACYSGSGSTGCSHDRMATAHCSLCRHSGRLPTLYQYFSNPKVGGTRQYMAYCPAWQPYSDGWCQETPGNWYRDNAYGVSYGPRSRCLLSTARANGYQPQTEATGRCFDLRCGRDELTVSIGESANVTCSATDAGVRKSPGRSWTGEVVCPNFTQLCGDSGMPTVNCMFPGLQTHGRCVCAAGHMDEDCSVEDTADNRPLYPFGLAYLQQELLLSTGTSVERSSGLSHWPFRPRTMDGPMELRYSVSPALPRGLELRASDGTLAGTPSQGAAWAPYTVRAEGGLGAATTTLFLEVQCAQDDCDMLTPEPPGDGDAFVDGAETVTGANNAAGAPRGLTLLRMRLRVGLAELQAPPGVESFASDFASAMSAAVGQPVTVTYLMNWQSGGVQVEFQAGTDSPSLGSAAAKLVELLESGEGSLHDSSFGKQHLDADIRDDFEEHGMLFKVIPEGGVDRLWPPAPAPSFWDIMTDVFTPWPRIVLMVLLGVLACSFLWSCRRNRGHTHCHGCGFFSTPPSTAPAHRGNAALVEACVIGAPMEARGGASTPQPPARPRSNGAFAPAAPPDVNAAMSQMLDMGFSHDRSVEALKQCNWDVPAAVQRLADPSRFPQTSP